MNKPANLIDYLKNTHGRIEKFYAGKQASQDKAMDLIADKIKKAAQIMLNLKKSYIK